jgi:membrane-associated phospholipid phosphatase
MRYLTDFADAAVLLPCIAVIIILLFVLGWRRGAVAWLIAAGGVCGAIVAGKVVLGACSALADAVGLRSPSGHTAAAALLGGGLAMMLWPSAAADASTTVRRIAWAVGAGLCVAVMIGVSRVALGLHNAADVVAGGVVGLLGAAALAWLAGPPPANVSPRALVALAIAVSVSFYGRHVSAEQTIRWGLQIGIWPPSLCRIG